MKITVTQKGNSRRVYLVNLKDWMDPDKFVITAQVPYIGAKDVIKKDNYETRLIETYFERRWIEWPI